MSQSDNKINMYVKCVFRSANLEKLLGCFYGIFQRYAREKAKFAWSTEVQEFALWETR